MVAERSIWRQCPGHQALQEPRSGPLPPKRDYRHHHKRWDQFPGDLFPELPRGRKAVCMLHGMEKIATWVLCAVYDFLEPACEGVEGEKRRWLCIWLGGGVGCMHLFAGVCLCCGVRPRNTGPRAICSALKLLVKWVNGSLPNDKPWVRHQKVERKNKAPELKDMMVGGHGAKMMFGVGGFADDGDCRERWNAMFHALPVVSDEVEVGMALGWEQLIVW